MDKRACGVAASGLRHQADARPPARPPRAAATALPPLQFCCTMPEADVTPEELARRWK
jgi:hypothetical protein